MSWEWHRGPPCMNSRSGVGGVSVDPTAWPPCASLFCSLKAAPVLRWVPGPEPGVRGPAGRTATLHPAAPGLAQSQTPSWGPAVCRVRCRLHKFFVWQLHHAPTSEVVPALYGRGTQLRGQVTMQGHRDEGGASFCVRGISQQAVVWHLYPSAC